MSSAATPSSDPSAGSRPAPASAGLDPRARLALLLGWSTLALTVHGWRGLLVLVVAAAALLGWVGHAWRGRALVAAVGLVWFTAASQAWFYDEPPLTPLLRLGPVHLSREGAVHGLTQSLRLVAVAWAAWGLLGPLGPDPLLRALRRLGAPSAAVLVLAAALRFLPWVLGAATTLREAAAERGQRLGLRHLAPLIARALRRAEVLADSLDTRGYDAEAPRSERRPLQWRVRDTGAVALAGATVVLVVVLRVLFELYASGLLYRPELRALYAFTRTWL